MTIGPITLHAREAFTSSKLPVKKEIVERMIWYLVPRAKGSFMKTSKEWAAMQVGEELCEHWVWCNIYPKHIKNVVKMVVVLYDEFKKLQSYPKARMTEKWVKEKLDPFMTSLEVGFDIRTMDITYRRKQEEISGVKETDDEEAFWQDQMEGKRVGFCDNFVDRKWLVMDARKRKDNESFQKRLEKSEAEKIEMNEKVEIPEDYDDVKNMSKDEDVEYQEEEAATVRKKRRIDTGGSKENTGVLPEGYRHIRNSIRHVRPEYYTAVDRYRNMDTLIFMFTTRCVICLTPLYRVILFTDPPLI